VLVGRLAMNLAKSDTGSRVPFYVLPTLGGASSVRSVDEFRFRAENMLFLGGEYRFGISKYVQLVGFVDAGKVANNSRNVLLDDNTRQAYGGGIRAGTESRTFIRMDVGTGGHEGTHFFIKFMPNF